MKKVEPLIVYVSQKMNKPMYSDGLRIFDIFFVVNTKADRQHAIASLLELSSTWANKIDYQSWRTHSQRIMQVST